MGLRAKHKYHGKVGPGSELYESQSGSLGYQVQLECEDGDTSYTIWLTQKNRDRARKTFTEALGVDPDKLTDQRYIENHLGLDIAGRDVTFVCEEEEYKGKRRVKVAWLFKRSATSGGNPAKAAASFFAKPADQPPASGSPPPIPADPITDDDIPF